MKKVLPYFFRTMGLYAPIPNIKRREKMKGKEVRNIVLTTKVNNRELEEITRNAMIRNTRVSELQQ